MTLPDRLTAAWIATLADGQLLQIESQLHGEFFVEETAEKRRRGGRYTLLQGPEALVIHQRARSARRSDVAS
jgi:hypothetical protein